MKKPSKKREAEIQRLSKNYPYLYASPPDLANFESWEKQKLEKLHGPKGEVIYLVIEHNISYGDLITRFQVDGNRLTTVEDRHWPGKMVWCNPSSGLTGARPFERDSLTWEFLYKPLGLQVDHATVPSTGADMDPATPTGGWDKMYTSFWFFCRVLVRAGGRHDSRDLSWLLNRKGSRQ